MLTRFSFTYDDEFDKDIHQLLQSTPEKRRSERLRQLVRLGLMAESSLSSAISVPASVQSDSPSAVEDDDTPSENKPGPESDSGEPSQTRERRAVRFQPPSS